MDANPIKLWMTGAAIGAIAGMLAACGGDAPETQTSETGTTETEIAETETDRVAGTQPSEDEIQEVAETIAKAFIPSADQFGLEQFKIVYKLEGQETGTRTLYVENYGAQVALEEDISFGAHKTQKVYYWSGERGHGQEAGQDAFSSGLRMKATEPTAFAVTRAKDLEMIGYERLGEKAIAGKTCEHWRNASLNYEGCRWNNIELEFHNGAGTAQIIQSLTTAELVEGEGIPDRLKALAE